VTRGFPQDTQLNVSPPRPLEPGEVGYIVFAGTNVLRLLMVAPCDAPVIVDKSDIVNSPLVIKSPSKYHQSVTRGIGKAHGSNHENRRISYCADCSGFPHQIGKKVQRANSHDIFGAVSESVRRTLISGGNKSAADHCIFFSSWYSDVVLNRRVLIPVGNPVGGIRTYLLYNLKRMHEAGYRFTFLAPKGEGFDSLKNDTASWEETEYTDVPPGKKAFFFGIVHALRKQKFDLIHSQGLHSGTLAALADFRRRIPHLITLHDVIIPGQNDFGRFATIKKWLISFATCRATCIIPVSHDCETNHLEFFPAWKKGPVQIKPILNGVDVDRLERSRKQFEIDRQPNLREQFGIGNDAVLGGFFGRLMPQKGFDLVLKALALLEQQGYGDRFHIVVTIDQSGYLKETLQDTAANPNVAKMVHFLPAVPNITPLLLQTDVLVMPSRWEACPILPMESLVLGTPMIGTDCIGLREVLRETPAAVVPNENAGILANVITAFVEHQQSVKDAAQAYVSEAAGRFDVNIATEQLLALYQTFAPIP
jgi:glycosyltransferase involved in cell wall biosynthesis